MRVGSQRGAGTVGCLFLIVVVGAGVYAGFMFAMPKVRHSSFQDRLTETLAYYARSPEDQIRERVVATAADFDIQLRPEQVQIARTGKRLTVDIAYDKLVDLRVWQKTLHFQIHRSGEF